MICLRYGGARAEGQFSRTFSNTLFQLPTSISYVQQIERNFRFRPQLCYPWFCQLRDQLPN
jgi:hypothetical protein